MNILRAGHKLGEPTPLFAKIELARIEELKKKFAGKQEENSNAKNGPINGDQAPIQKNEINPEEIKKLEEEITRQVSGLM